MPMRSTAFSFVTLAAFLMSGVAMADEMTITGDISYRERIALPENAIATVSLLDVSLADAPSQTIAQHVIDPAGQVPIGFILDFDTADIVAGHSYAISARIEVEGELWFINDTRISVDPANHDAPVSVPLVNARGVSDTPRTQEPDDQAVDDQAAGLVGTSWVLVALDGEGIAEGVDSTLMFGADDGSVGGNGGCNSYGGSIAYHDDGSIDISEVFSTMMACEEPKMGTERGFFDALERTSTYEIEGPTLTLFDEAGNAVAVLNAAESDLAQAGTDAAPAQLLDTDWRAVSLGGVETAAGVETTLTFRADGTAGGNSGCNGYGGPVGIGEDGAIALGNFVATQRGCSDPEGSQERALFDAFTKAAAFELVDGRLILSDASGTVVAEFVAQ